VRAGDVVGVFRRGELRGRRRRPRRTGWQPGSPRPSWGRGKQGPRPGTGPSSRRREAPRRHRLGWCGRGFQQRPARGRPRTCGQRKGTGAVVIRDDVAQFLAGNGAQIRGRRRVVRWLVGRRAVREVEDR
jgi:hypothetical protein